MCLLNVDERIVARCAGAEWMYGYKERSAYRPTGVPLLFQRGRSSPATGTIEEGRVVTMDLKTTAGI